MNGARRAAAAAGGAAAALALWASMTFAQAPEGGYRVFRPDGAGPHPAVAFVSGCSGFKPAIAPRSYERVAETLRRQGYIVLFVDYVGRRGAPSCAKGPITEGEAAKDLVAAVAWLRAQPFVDPARIAALGWSYGGGAVLVALTRYNEAELGIARAVVYYPLCRAVRPWSVATPVLMLFAGDDEVAPSKGCQDVARQSSPPASVKTVTYHGALHGFDVSELPAETRWVGGTVGYNPSAAAAAWAEIEQFLKSLRPAR
jgi:dienelactone hydrolase